MAAPGSHATADLKDKDGKTVGKAVLRDTADGVLVRLEVKGLTPGLHAVHVHAVGKCEGPALPARADISTRCKESTVLKIPMARTPAICRICS
jgi:Cu/Zn superoxide dismutase